MRPLKLLTFDITNTLIKVNISPAYQYASMAKKCGVHVDESAIRDVYNAEWEKFKHEYPIYGAHQGMTCKTWWHKFVFRVFESAGYRGSRQQLADVARKLHTEFPQRADFWKVLPGATSVLQQLQRHGIQLAVLSNFDDRLDDVLDMLALRSYFGVIVTSFQAKCEKPSREIFQTVLNTCEVNAEDAIHIGDNLEEDYMGALNAGMRAILFDPAQNHKPFQYESPNRGFRIENLTEIWNIVNLDNKGIYIKEEGKSAVK